MSDNRPLESNTATAGYNSLTATINYEYCKKYNYDFVYYHPYLQSKQVVHMNNCTDPSTNSPRHAAWSKLLSTMLALQLSYDYVVYIDSDCIFKNFNQSLESFIEPYITKDVIFLNNKPWGDNLPCSGFYVCKVCDSTKSFIRDWYNVCIPQNNVTHPWEQNALWKIFNTYNIAIVDSWMFREEPGQYLRHVGSCEAADRIPYFTEFIRIHAINHSKNINAMMTISYNTSKISFSPIAINVFLVCYNESALLPHTIKHYKKYLPSCNITILDNQSTDNSVELATSLGCTSVEWSTNDMIDDIKLRHLKNTCWKGVKSGWVIVADMDEYLCVTELELQKEYYDETTILTVDGLDMIGESSTITLTDIDLQDICKYVDNHVYESKKLCFLRDKIIDINYDFGAHTCYPTGHVKYSVSSYKNKHMNYLGLPYITDKMIKRHARSEQMRKRGLAVHYTDNITVITERYNTAMRNCKLLSKD